MGTSSARRVLAGGGGLLALAVIAGGCGGSAAPLSSAAAPPARASGSSARAAAFAWPRSASAPAGWRSARLSTGATLPYPPGWRTLPGDRGTATAALLDARGRYLGYLNLTPRQGGEMLANWSSFRLRHNRAEGERDVQMEDAARDLRFRMARGSCVRDSYTTATGARYVEVACLVRGGRAGTVVVGAALQSAWAIERATIERALSALST
jgi:hypothetical protein